MCNAISGSIALRFGFSCRLVHSVFFEAKVASRDVLGREGDHNYAMGTSGGVLYFLCCGFLFFNLDSPPSCAKHSPGFSNYRGFPPVFVGDDFIPWLKRRDEKMVDIGMGVVKIFRQRQPQAGMSRQMGRHSRLLGCVF